MHVLSKECKNGIEILVGWVVFLKTPSPGSLPLEVIVWKAERPFSQICKCIPLTVQVHKDFHPYNLLQ